MSNKNRILPLLTILSMGLMFLTIGCKKDPAIPGNPVPIEQDPIVGQWQWTKTIAGFSQYETTPQSEGYTLALKFKSDGMVNNYYNGVKIDSNPYSFEYRINDILNPNSDSTLMLIIDNVVKAFFYITDDELIISQAYVDGSEDTYKRIQ